MRTYHALLQHILQTGERTPTRAVLKSTGATVDAISTFGYQARFDLRSTFPAVTGKRLFWKGVVHELLWFLSGCTNVLPLQEAGVNIWNEWANEDGELGPIYGSQWRNWGETGIDQIKQVIEGIKKDPHGRRHIVSAWNVADISKMALPPCHMIFQFQVYKGALHCHMNQRSADAVLGVPFNIASYALLTALVGRATGYPPGELIISFGNLHIYTNHLDGVNEYLKRQPYPLPSLVLADKTDIDSWQGSDIQLQGYRSHSELKLEIAV